MKQEINHRKRNRGGKKDYMETKQDTEQPMGQ